MFLDLGRWGAAVCLVEACSGRALSHAEAAEEVRNRARAWAGPKLLVMVAAAPLMDRVLDWLAAVQAGHAVMLLPPDLAPARLADLIRRYRPQALLGFDGQVFPDDADALHPDLCLVLSTSGSSGAPRMVRLSAQAIQANAASIAAALDIGPGQIAATALPLSYSYGLSVLHSHLWAGGCVVLTGESVLTRPFWATATAQGLTSLAGVPFMWSALRRLDLNILAPASLRVFTQAGGKMDDALTAYYHALAAARGGRLYVMYGQTEAAARMAVLPPHLLPDKLGSAGQAIAGGTFNIEDGQIIYRGPNVMMGYAQNRGDLALGDQMGGVLPTGDCGRLDEDCCLWIQGRLGRLVKILGLRFDLDDVEKRAQSLGETAITAAADCLTLYCVGALPDASARAAFAADLGLSPGALRWRKIDCLPRTESGKLDYPALGKNAP